MVNPALRALRDSFDITVFVGERNDFDVSSIDLNKRFLTSREELTLGAKPAPHTAG